MIRCAYCHEVTDVPSLMGWTRIDDGSRVQFCSAWHWLLYIGPLWRERSAK